MQVIDSKDVYNIIVRALGMVNKQVIDHGEITGYIFYKMLEEENAYTKQELVQYAMVGVLHDLGIFKAGSSNNIYYYETNDVWNHSIYGYLFLRYLSPIGNKAEIVLYHHLPYEKHSLIQSPYLKIASYLTLADKMDLYMHGQSEQMGKDYFVEQADKEFSKKALDLFFAAEKHHHITDKLRSGEYKEELNHLISSGVFSDELKRGYLQMLIYTIDFRSEYTVVHTLATTRFAQEIARIMKVSREGREKLYYGALLHDIGKLAIPIEILEAPRRLNDKEMEVMKSHVAITEKILRGIIQEDVLEIAIRHHEKIDGSGYHRGINGEELTLEQRIVAVADIISALYGKRSYKDSFESEKIISILQGDADNNKIAKEVVDVAVANFNKLIADFEKSKDETIGLYMQIIKQHKEFYEKFKGL